MPPNITSQGLFRFTLLRKLVLIAASLSICSPALMFGEPNADQSIKARSNGQATVNSNGQATMNIGSEIQGQQAQPSLLFILPWQEQEDIGLRLKREKLLDKDFLAPVERDAFQKETKLINTMNK